MNSGLSAIKASPSPTAILLILLLGAAGMAALLALVPAAGHDQLWFLLMAQRWLHGAALYGPEAFDSNTPAIVWLSAIPALLAEHLSLSVTLAAKLLVLALEVAIAAFAWRIFKLSQPSWSPSQLLFLAFAFVVLLAVAPARDFGQRDHLAALLCLPYLLAAALPVALPQPRSFTTALRLLAGLLAASAFCLKPQLVLIALAIELFILLRKNLASRAALEPLTVRNRLASFTRPEPWALLFGGALFLAAVHHFTPLFFSSALPTSLSTYWAIGHLTPFQLFQESLQLHLLAALAFALFLLERPPASSKPLPGLRPATGVLLVAGSAAAFAYYVQGTGWYYQQLPAITFFGGALALHLIRRTAGRSPRIPAWVVAATATLTLVALALTLHFSGYPFSLHAFTQDRAYSIATPDPTFFAGLPPGAPVATLTTSVDDAIMPIVRYRLTWAQRTNNLWTLPAILRSEDPESSGWGIPPGHKIPPPRLARLAAQQRLWMVEDLTRWQPVLILVARCQDPAVHCQVLEDRHDNLLAFFEHDPRFSAIFSHYRFFRGSGPYDAYTLASPQ